MWAIHGLFLPSLVQTALMVSEEKFNMKKVNDRCQVMAKAHPEF
jgi:hypothetical protein